MDNPESRLVCLILVGIADLSFVYIAIPAGLEHHFNKVIYWACFILGDSTHCLKFGRNVHMERVFPPSLPPPTKFVLTPVSSKLAVISAKKTKTQ